MMVTFWVDRRPESKHNNAVINNVVINHRRLDELEAFLAEQTTEVTEYDEGLVRQLIEKITVYDDSLAFEFKSGLETEV